MPWPLPHERPFGAAPVSLAAAGLTALILALASCQSSEPAPRPDADQGASPREATPRAPAAAQLESVELVTGGASADEPLPLVVAIHGLGDRPESFVHLLRGLPTRARVVAPRGPDRYGPGYSWMSASGTEAQLDRAVETAVEAVVELIREVSARRPTAGKAVVTGFSQGGILSFALAAGHPELLAGAVPIGGWLPRSAWPGEGGGAGLKVRAMNGGDDGLVAVLDVRRSVVKLALTGFDAKVRVYRGVGHSISAEMRADLFAILASMLEPDQTEPPPCPPCPGESTVPGSCSLCPEPRRRQPMP